MKIKFSVSKKKLFLGSVLMLLAISSAYALGTDHTGSSDTIAALFKSWKGTALTALTFVQFVSGFGGMILIIMGLFHLRTGHGGQGGGQQVQAKNGFIHMTLGGALLVVGTIAAILGHTAGTGVKGDINQGLSGYTFSGTQG